MRSVSLCLSACLAAFAYSALVGCGREPGPAAAVASVSKGATPVEPARPAQISILCQTQRVPVIMYHDIIETRGPGSVWFDCSKEEFEAQMERLFQEGYVPISLDDLYAHLVEGQEIPRRAVVLTFDDNYQGFYDHALPILRKYRYPAAMFVHTGFVGDTKGRGKMSWDTLRELVEEGLVTIGGHTITHPADMRKLSRAEQEKELKASKEELERELKTKIKYLAYPEGKNDTVTRELARALGYKMAFSIDNGPAQESPDLFNVNRYIHTRFDKALQECEEALQAPAAIVDAEIRNGPVSLVANEYMGVRIAMVKGGLPVSWKLWGRQPVGDFIQKAEGVAGINGTFFSDSNLKSENNEMVGPCLTQADEGFRPDFNESRTPRLRNRPVVMWGKHRMMFVPFQRYMNDRQPFLDLFPDFTDLFVAGGWLVHEGLPLTPDQILRYGSKDMQDTRKRAFFGIDWEGNVVMGATLKVQTSSGLAEALAAAGVREAVLLDSGFSTSLVYDDKIIATGHTAENLPSRPVPHAIVLRGELSEFLDETTVAMLPKRLKLTPKTGEDQLASSP